VDIVVKKNTRRDIEIKAQEILLNENDEVFMDELISQLKRNSTFETSFFDNTLISVYN
jgi:hypothetical protein